MRLFKRRTARDGRFEEPTAMTHGRAIAALFFVIAATSACAEENSLTEKEKQEGWLLLFDGKTTNGWMTTKSKPLAKSYVQDGWLNPHPCSYMLVHEKVWGDFVL